MSSEPDEVMREMGVALALSQRGERSEARSAFQSLWNRVGDDGDPFHRCAIAHSMADVQDDPNDELSWDLRALAAAEELTDERVTDGGVAASVAAFYPSLHLNLADVYLRLGELALAQDHVTASRAALVHLSPDGYASMISGALDRVEDDLAEVSSATVATAPRRKP